MIRHKKWQSTILIGVLILLLVSCQTLRRPDVQSKKNAPAIPKAIAQGERKEPVLKVYFKEDQKVKSMPVEEYIAGVVAAEMDPNWPVEALAAQAILARTFTLEKIAREGGVPNRGAHASTDIEEFQAYDASRVNDKVRQVVKATRGQIAAYQGNYIRAWFHANSGGKTATAAEGLSFHKEPTPYVVSVDDAISQQAAVEKDSSWSLTVNKSDVIKALQKIGKKVDSFNKVEIAEKGDSGRATKLRIGSVTVSAPEFRLAIGSTELKSALIDSITVSGNKVTFKGKGYGHGVGMSQWGAKGRADQGAKAEEIIKAYFRDVNIVSVWD